MTHPVIAFIGGGNMASSLIGGLVSDGYPTRSIIVTDPDKDKLGSLAGKLKVRTESDNAMAVREANVLVLAVKPQVLKEVCTAIRAEVQQRKPLVISIAAGIRSVDIERWLGDDLPLVRTMPNTPALVGPEPQEWSRTAGSVLSRNSRLSR